MFDIEYLKNSKRRLCRHQHLFSKCHFQQARIRLFAVVDDLTLECLDGTEVSTSSWGSERSPVLVPPQTNFSIMFTLPVIKINLGSRTASESTVKKSNTSEVYQILDFISFSQVGQSPSELSIHGYWSKFLVTVTGGPSWRQLAADYRTRQ